MSKQLDFHFKSPSESPGYLLSQVSLIWQRKQKKVLDPLNLTHTQFVLLASLAWLLKGNKSVTQVDMANHTNFDRMMVSKVLRTLESKEYISRKEHETDTRAKIINLTIEGAKLLQMAIIAVENADIEFFESIDSELGSFNANMGKLISKNTE